MSLSDAELLEHGTMFAVLARQNCTTWVFVESSSVLAASQLLFKLDDGLAAVSGFVQPAFSRILI